MTNVKEGEKEEEEEGAKVEYVANHFYSNIAIQGADKSLARPGSNKLQ